MHGLWYFLHNLMALEWVACDWMAEDNFGFDQVIDGPDVHDLTALVRADHDRTIMEGSRFNWNSVFLLKHYFYNCGAYIAPIDELFIALESWWRPESVEWLQERFQRAFVKILRILIERFLYKSWVVSFSCIDFILFSHSKAWTSCGGRLEADP